MTNRTFPQRDDHAGQHRQAIGRSRWKAWRVPLFLVIVPVGTISGCIVSLLLLFVMIGEVSGEGLRVRQQEWFNSLYHSPFIEVVVYKEAMLRAHTPKIAVIGTSRAGSFREAFFSQPFVNLASTVDSPAELNAFIGRNFRGINRPDHLLIVAEIWWFVDIPVKGRKPQTKRTLEQKFLSVGRYFTHPKKGERRRTALWQSLLSYDAGSFMGIHGHLRREGFSKRGSFHYEQIITGVRKSNDRNFMYSFESIGKGEHRFKHSSQLNEARFKEFKRALQLLDRIGISYTVILPPFAPSVAARMTTADFPHHALLVDRLRSEGVSVFDFTRPEELGDDDCEYIDGFHGGDVVYARLLAKIADRQPEVSGFVRRSLLDDISTRKRGSAAWSRRTKLPEIDFLDLGCNR